MKFGLLTLILVAKALNKTKTEAQCLDDEMISFLTALNQCDFNVREIVCDNYASSVSCFS